jgi:hypothetical protein
MKRTTLAKWKIFFFQEVELLNLPGRKLHTPVSCYICQNGLYIFLSFLSQGTQQNDDSFTTSEDSLLGRHRNRATTISACSPTSTFNSGSSASSTVNSQKHRLYYNRCQDRRMSVGNQKELNLLITAPQVPDLSTGEDSLKAKVTVEEPSVQDNHVCEIIPQPQLQPEHTCQPNGDAVQSPESPQLPIAWGPQVSPVHLFLLTYRYIGRDMASRGSPKYLQEISRVPGGSVVDRHYARSRKVVHSRPDKINTFFQFT